jgi:hypothetical protein
VNQQLEQALIQAAVEHGVPIAIELAESLSGAIVALIQRLGTAETQGDALSVACRIVAGIDTDHPTWPNDQRRRYARDAILAYLGPGASESAANALLELAVQKVRAA